MEEGALTSSAVLANLGTVQGVGVPMAREESGSRPVTAGLDIRLIQRARSGDREAFRRVYERYAPMVHGILISRVRPQDAQDLAQDVFLKALKSMSSLREPERIGSWLAAIARNAGRDALRRSRPTESLPAEVEDPDSRDTTTAREVLEVMQSLPESYRETLALRLVEGMTGPEIAERAGLTPGSVRVNLSRGMKLLRERLSKRGLP